MSFRTQHFINGKYRLAKWHLTIKQVIKSNLPTIQKLMDFPLWSHHKPCRMRSAPSEMHYTSLPPATASLNREPHRNTDNLLNMHQPQPHFLADQKFRQGKNRFPLTLVKSYIASGLIPWKQGFYVKYMQKSFLCLNMTHYLIHCASKIVSSALRVLLAVNALNVNDIFIFNSFCSGSAKCRTLVQVFSPAGSLLGFLSEASSQTLSKKEPSDSSQAITWTVNMVCVPRMTTLHSRLPSYCYSCNLGLCGTLVTCHIVTEFMLEWNLRHLYYISSVTLSFYYAMYKYRFSYWFYRETYTKGFLLWLSCYLWIPSDLIRSFLCFHLHH